MNDNYGKHTITLTTAELEVLLVLLYSSCQNGDDMIASGTHTPDLVDGLKMVVLLVNTIQTQTGFTISSFDVPATVN